MCSICGSGRLESYSDMKDSLLNHSNFFGAVLLHGTAFFRDIPFTDVLKCTSCNRYGYRCPHCSREASFDTLPAHGTLKVCISSTCRKEFYMRNPSNIFSLK